MRPFIQLSVIPDGQASRISVQVFAGEQQKLAGRVYFREARAPIYPEVTGETASVYALRCLMAAAWMVASASYPYPRDALLEALDHFGGITVSSDWAGGPDKSPGDQPR